MARQKKKNRLTGQKPKIKNKKALSGYAFGLNGTSRAAGQELGVGRGKKIEAKRHQAPGRLQ